MKTLFSSIILSFLGISISFSQNSTVLDIGNVEALINSNALLFYDSKTFEGAYEVPKGEGTNTIYSSSLWMSSRPGLRNGKSVITFAYEQYGLDNYFKVGPVDLVNQKAETSTDFQRLWKVNRSEIDDHIKNWNTANYVLPKSIEDWPGNGNANTANNLAPYEDLDGDNIYEPKNGEYPIIKGDQAVFLMINDFRPSDSLVFQDQNGADTTLMYLEPLKVELHLMLYAFDTSLQAIANSVFVDLKVFNRSNTSTDDHDDFKFSVYSDFDLGFALDDYVGTSVSNNLFYAYNGDLFDENFAGSNGFADKLAAQGIQFLSNNIDHSRSYNSGSGANGSVNFPIEAYFYQRKQWRDASPVYYGGNAFDSCIDTTRVTTFMYTGDPTLTNDTTQWTEENPCFDGGLTPNNSGDRRMIGGPDVPATLNHGDSLEFTYAYIFAKDDKKSTKIGDPVSKLFLVADTVQDFFDDNLLVSLIPKERKLFQASFGIYPNPAKNSININFNQDDFDLELIGIDGKVIEQWKNQKSIDVNGYTSGVYFLRLKTDDQIAIKTLIIQ